MKTSNAMNRVESQITQFATICGHSIKCTTLLAEPPSLSSGLKRKKIEHVIPWEVFSVVRGTVSHVSDKRCGLFYGSAKQCVQ